MKKRSPIMLLIACVIVHSSVCNETFVKPRTSRGVSTASLKEECGILMADMLELSQTCLQQLLDTCCQSLLALQQSITKTVRCLIYDDACMIDLSKAALSERRDKLVLLKRRLQKTCAELNRLSSELHIIKKELKELEAA